MKQVVIDCSVTMSWLFEDEQDPAATALVRETPAIRFLVPTIWPLEVANVLALTERRGRVTEADSTRGLGYLSNLPIEIDDAATRNAFGAILGLARALQVTAYDATYLELAMRLDLPIATLDRQLKSAAQRLNLATAL